jgi:membrane protease YdiL (CAAX protease family)
VRNLMRGTAIYFALPLILWPLSFILLRSVFIYALTASTALLAAFTLYRFRKKIKWTRTKNKIAVLAAGFVAALALYLIFVLGKSLSSALGLGAYVSSVYASIYGSQPLAITFVLIAMIGVFEEIYWRGGLQGYVESSKSSFSSMPWVLSTAYYTVVHISTLNPILVAAAWVVGLVTGVLARRFGILASILTHVVWIEAVVVFFPL